MTGASKHLSSGTRVRVLSPGPVPLHSTWDDDGQRTSTPVKRRLQTLFFQGHQKVAAEVLHIASEAERDRLRAKGLCKVQLRDPAGSLIVITAPLENLRRAS